MNKPTHIGVIKNFNELFKLDRSLWPVVISAGYMKDLAELMGHEIEVDQKEDHIKENYYGTGDILIHRDWFQDLQEIKPKIEIPEIPFWVDDGDELRCVEILAQGYYQGRYQYGQSTFKEPNLKELINNGTWTICEEPKKEMVNVQAYEILNEIAEKFGMKVIKEV